MGLTTAAQRYKQAAPSARSGLAAFLVYCQVEDTTDLRAADAVDLLRALVGQRYSPDTISRYKTAINGFFRWLYTTELVAFDADALQQAFFDQGAILTRRKQARRVGPEEADVRHLLEAAYSVLPAAPLDTPKGWRGHLTYLRNIAAVKMLRATGARPR